MDTKLKKLTETEKRILLWMLLDLSMVLILCGKLLRKCGATSNGVSALE